MSNAEPVDNPGRSGAGEGESADLRDKRYRRYPWLSREDMHILLALPADDARRFERLLHAQANLDKRTLLHQVDAPHGVELAHGAFVARHLHGTGGGFKRPTYPGCD